MLRVRRDQWLAFQAARDRSLIEPYVEATKEPASRRGLDDATHRARIIKGLGLARHLGAVRSEELSLVVALTVFVHPDWQDGPLAREVLARRGMKLEAKLRLLLHVSLQAVRGEG